MKRILALVAAGVIALSAACSELPVRPSPTISGSYMEQARHELRHCENLWEHKYDRAMCRHETMTAWLIRIYMEQF